MEALGAVSSSLTLLDVGVVGVWKTVQTLKRLNNAPRDLQDVLEQVEALEAVISAISDTTLIDRIPQGLGALIERLKRQLLDLEKLIHFKLVKPVENLEVDRVAWTCHASEVTRKLSDIQKTTDYISTILSAATYIQTAEVHRRMKGLLLLTASGQENQEHAMSLMMRRLDAMTGVCRHIQSSAATPRVIEDLLKPIQRSVVQVSQDHTPLKSNRVHQFQYNCPLPTLHNESIPGVAVSMKLSDSNLAPRNRPGTCRCRCHKRRTLALPSSLRYWIGSLHVTIAESRWTQMPCTVPSCQTGCPKRGNMSATLQYTFPPWIAATMISAWYKGTSAGSIERVIRLVQIVRTDAFYLAEKGDLSSLHDLYARGKGSIHDVNSSDGKTALMFAVRSNCFALIRYLLSQGADLLQQDFAGWDTRDVMLESYLNPGQDSHEELCAFFDVNDALEEQEFTLIHRIVLGRSSRNLTEELAEHPDLLDRPDSKGRTPLYWAVWCGEFESVRLLLQHGADVSITSNKGNNIYHVMATSPVGGEMFSFIDQGSGHVQCSMKMQSHCLNVRNLIQTTPWHRAIRFDQTILLKSFLKYMPELDAKDGCEMTFFHYAALYANTEMLYLLTIADLDPVDLLAECMYGNTGVDYVVARLSNDVYWNEAPEYSEEAAEALVRFVAHARKFEPRLPRLICVIQGEEESRFPAYGLLYPDGLCKIYHGIRAWDVYDSEDQLGMWADVEDWLGEQGQLNMHEAWKSDSGGIDGLKDKRESKEEDEEESFFDAMDSSYICESTPPNCPDSPASPWPSGTPGSDRVEASSGKVDTGWHNQGPPAQCMQRASICDAKRSRSSYLIIPGGRRLFKSK